MSERTRAQRRLRAMLRHMAPRVPRVAAVASSAVAQAKRLVHAREGTPDTPHAAAQDAVPGMPGTVRRGKSLVTFISPRKGEQAATLSSGVLLVAHTRADVRRRFIEQLCERALKTSALIYAIAPHGSASIDTPGVFKLTTHPTLSRRAVLAALLRHGAHMLVFGVINTRDDVMALLDAAYTGYHVVAEIYGESARDVLSRLEAIGVDVSLLPQNLRIVVPG